MLLMAHHDAGIALAAVLLVEPPRWKRRRNRAIFKACISSDDPALPYDAKEDKVVEESIHSLGEVSEIKPGGHGTLALQLKPGSYLLLCNQPGHYHAGMYSTLAVIP